MRFRCAAEYHGFLITLRRLVVARLLFGRRGFEWELLDVGRNLPGLKPGAGCFATSGRSEVTHWTWFDGRIPSYSLTEDLRWELSSIWRNLVGL